MHTTRKQLNECIAYLHVKDCWGKSSHFLFGRSTTQVQEDKQRKLNYHHPMGANILPLHLFPAIYPARGDLVWKKYHLFLLVSLHPLIWTKYIAGTLCEYLCAVIIDMCLPCTRIRVLTPPPPLRNSAAYICDTPRTRSIMLELYNVLIIKVLY